ncbi:MAG TPA: guanylate kinase [Planctomycetaceae bacterium]|nr:guanylate kinase [Planctomycetaceae bacterium]
MDASHSDKPRPFRVVVLSGPSGSGKTTIVSRLLGDPRLPLVKSISATTRPRRAGEIDGRHYYFLSQEEFDRRRADGEFLECAEVHGAGSWYGTLKSEIDRARQLGGWAFLEIDVEGALNVMREYPDALTIFLTTPSDDEYERRLRSRGTESDDQIERRLATARRELTFIDRYRHSVVNDDLDRATREIGEILLSDRP